MAEWLFRRFGHHYILVSLILTRIYGSVGGLLVIFYVELTLQLPDQIRTDFRMAAAVVVCIACTLAVLLAMWETRHLRQVLLHLDLRKPIDPRLAFEAGREAVTFVPRHHWNESWLVPLTTLVPVLIFLRVVSGADATVLMNISLAVFMGIAMALMSTFFALDHYMQPVIRRLLDKGVSIDYESLPTGRLRFRFGLCSTLIILTTALMIGTLARQRAADIIADRDGRPQAVAELRSHSIYITVAAVITGIGYSSLLSRSVASRVDKLVRAMEHVKGGDFSKRVRPTGNDEIDILARRFNQMVQQLEHNHHTIRDLNTNLERKVQDRTQQLEATLQELREAQTQLTDVAHRAGMAEIATGVLHNVGNVLNSVNISTTVLGDRLRRCRLEDLDRLSKRLTDQGDNLETFLSTEGRGVKMVEYLSKLSSQMSDEQEELLEEVASLTEKVGHIRGIISAQQNYARRVPFKEQIDLGTLVEGVLEMHGPSLSKHEIEARCDFGDVPPAHLEKAKLVQVLDNLIKNGIESIVDADSLQRVLTIRLEPREPDGARMVVSDTGGGITPENLDTIFNYGFTTKRNGNGFGLHSSALAISELGGTMRVESDGPGRGASFTVEFPLDAEAESPVADIASSAVPAGVA